MDSAELTGQYGLWSLVIINSALFIFFAFSFFKPKTKRDWRAFGAFSTFLIPDWRYARSGRWSLSSETNGAGMRRRHRALFQGLNR